MASPQRVFVAPYQNKSLDHLSKQQQEIEIQPNVKSIATHLANLNRRTGGKLFEDAVILHSERPPAALIAEKLSKVIPAQTVVSERAYVLGDNPRTVDAPRDWLLRGAREVLGDDWNGSPLIALAPAGFVDYLNHNYDPLALKHDIGPEPLIELTPDMVWPVHPQQQEFADAFFEERKIQQEAGFGVLI